ncbi:hypothetical protein N0V90_003420 [Kalmusia sp. IMI 367209]|nr:hypothetical protein N0V90_003420 [Kalmusia sp. IMI 367209]
MSMIVLEMGPADGPIGDAGRFADAIKGVRKQLYDKRWLPMSHFLLVLSVPDYHEAGDMYEKFYAYLHLYLTEVYHLLEEHSGRFLVEFTNTSILEAKASNHYQQYNIRKLVDKEVKKIYEIPIQVRFVPEKPKNATKKEEEEAAKKGNVQRRQESNFGTGEQTVQGLDTLLSYFGTTQDRLWNKLGYEMEEELAEKREALKKTGGDPRTLKWNDEERRERVQNKIEDYEAEFRRLKTANHEQKYKNVKDHLKKCQHLVKALKYFEEHGSLPPKTGLKKVTNPAVGNDVTSEGSKAEFPIVIEDEPQEESTSLSSIQTPDFNRFQSVQHALNPGSPTEESVPVYTGPIFQRMLPQQPVHPVPTPSSVQLPKYPPNISHRSLRAPLKQHSPTAPLLAVVDPANNLPVSVYNQSVQPPANVLYIQT